jgi:amino acid permease
VNDIPFIAEAVYILCAVTAMTCAFLLARANQKTPSRFLLFASVCFGALAINSVLLVLDRIIFPSEMDLRVWRLGAATLGLFVLLWALITQRDQA